MKRIPVSVLALVVAFGCKGEGDDTGDTDTGCDNSIIEIFPADGSTDAYYRTTIEVKFDDMEEDATFTVTPSGGSALTGDYTWVEDRLVFTPAAALAPSTGHTVSITYSCASDVEATFTTSEVGSAVNLTDDPLDGRSYLLDLSSGRFVEPEGVGDIIGDFLDQIVVVGVDNVDTDLSQITMLGALGEQDSGASDGAHTADDSEVGIFQSCETSITFPSGIDFAGNPFFAAGPADTSISVAGFDITIEDLLISGAFGPDGGYIAGATLGGKIDTRPLVPLVSSSPAPCDQETYDNGSEVVTNPNYPCDPNAICEIAGSLFIECEACGSTSTSTECSDTEDACCLSLLVDSITAIELLDPSDAAWSLTATSEPGSGDTGTGAAGDPIDPCDVDGITCPAEDCPTR